ncbi:hypothetical protein GJ496_009897 [Pomphorhynchus laevis]|nr:hypothetical protein GJ496_009897 [Pomphorhynchus laevis]
MVIHCREISQHLLTKRYTDIKSAIYNFLNDKQNNAAKRIIIMGHPRSCKSYIAEQLARQFDLIFVNETLKQEDNISPDYISSDLSSNSFHLFKPILSRLAQLTKFGEYSRRGWVLAYDCENENDLFLLKDLLPSFIVIIESDRDEMLQRCMNAKRDQFTGRAYTNLDMPEDLTIRLKLVPDTTQTNVLLDQYDKLNSMMDLIKSNFKTKLFRLIGINVDCLWKEVYNFVNQYTNEHITTIKRIVIVGPSSSSNRQLSAKISDKYGMQIIDSTKIFEDILNDDGELLLNKQLFSNDLKLGQATYCMNEIHRKITRLREQGWILIDFLNSLEEASIFVDIIQKHTPLSIIINPVRLNNEKSITDNEKDKIMNFYSNIWKINQMLEDSPHINVKIVGYNFKIEEI